MLEQTSIVFLSVQRLKSDVRSLKYNLLEHVGTNLSVQLLNPFHDRRNYYSKIDIPNI